MIIDTAGLRPTDDTIEKEGVERSKQTAAEADLVIHLIDSSQPMEKDEMAWADDTHSRKILSGTSTRWIFQGIGQHYTTKTALKVSCVSGEGIETLKDAIFEAVWSGAAPTEFHEVMINSRHEDALLRCMESMLEVQEGLQVERELELIAMDLRLALSALGEVVEKPRPKTSSMPFSASFASENNRHYLGTGGLSVGRRGTISTLPL